MAKLSGVKTDRMSDGVIYYDGTEYRKSCEKPRAGDILRCEDEYGFLTKNAYYLAEEDGDGSVYASDNHNDEDYEVGVDYTVFRRVESVPQAPQTLAEIRALIEQKRAEIAELEAQIAINVDDYVRVTGRTYDGVFNVGDVAQVTHYDGEDYDHPYLLRTIIRESSDWADADSIVKITPAEAKAALIAHVEELFLS